MIITEAGESMDWDGWMARWDRQQEGYMANREERFDVITDVIAHAVGDEPVVLDLCCGPGSLSARVLKRFPTARIIAIDADPVLQLLGRKVLGDASGKLTWVRHDLADPMWTEAVARDRPFDAVVSTTALHWLRAGTLANAYEAVGCLLRPGGVFANGDHQYDDAAQPRLRALQRSVRVIPEAPREDYQAWWGALAAEAAHDAELAAAFDTRMTTGTGHPETESRPTLSFHEAALRTAGFTEVGTVWQRGDDHVLVGFRAD